MATQFMMGPTTTAALLKACPNAPIKSQNTITTTKKHTQKSQLVLCGLTDIHFWRFLFCSRCILKTRVVLAVNRSSLISINKCALCAPPFNSKCRSSTHKHTHANWPSYSFGPAGRTQLRNKRANKETPSFCTPFRVGFDCEIG